MAACCGDQVRWLADGVVGSLACCGETGARMGATGVATEAPSNATGAAPAPGMRQATLGVLLPDAMGGTAWPGVCAGAGAHRAAGGGDADCRS